MTNTAHYHPSGRTEPGRKGVIDSPGLSQGCRLSNIPACNLLWKIPKATQRSISQLTANWKPALSLVTHP